jgi:hypothetical protein
MDFLAATLPMPLALLLALIAQGPGLIAEQAILWLCVPVTSLDCVASVAAPAVWPMGQKLLSGSLV